MSSMSMPREMMSVATMTSSWPLLNWNIISSRSAWSRSECISPQLTFMRFSEAAICFTFCLEPEKMMTRLRSPALKMSLRIAIFCVS